MTIALAEISQQREGVSVGAESFAVFTAVVQVCIRGGSPIGSSPLMGEVR
jgi:hypothetical protein